MEKRRGSRGRGKGSSGVVEGKGSWGSNLENSKTSKEWMGWRGPDGRCGGGVGKREAGNLESNGGDTVFGGGEAGKEWGGDRRKAKEVLGEGRDEVGRLRVDAVTEPEGSGLTRLPEEN